MLRTDRLAEVIRGQKKSVLYAGAALALAGAGTASAVAAGTTPSAPRTSAPISTQVHLAAPARAANRAQAKPRRSAPASHVPASAATARAAVVNAAPQHPSAHPVRPAKPAAPAKPAKAVYAVKTVTWSGISGKLNRETNPAAARRGELPSADKLLPVTTSGQQTAMPITPAQYANAATIVHQALAKRMGLRSAVIAVATAMQESRLVNVSYGTGASLGLFQQQTDMGWGTAAQVMNPAYASRAFLTALQQYQASNPQWAREPLYQAAQGVQKSAFPLAYAQWESQAAHLVRSIVMQMA